MMSSISIADLDKVRAPGEGPRCKSRLLDTTIDPAKDEHVLNR
jgi:hypothetical protein